MLKSFTAISASALALALSAHAQEAETGDAVKPATEVAEAFKAIDADADGKLTLAEVQNVDEGVSEEAFAEYDADEDENLSMVEFAKWQSDAKASQSAG